MARITFPSPDTMNAEQLAVYEDIVSGPRGTLVGPLRAALHNPALADRWQQLGRVLRFETSLPGRLNELAILVTARRWNSVVEWAIHSRDAARFGLAETVIESIRIGEIPHFGDDVSAAEIYEYARQLVATGDVEQELYDAVKDRWGEIGVVELAAVVGYYSMVALTLNVHRIPLPQGMSGGLVSVENQLFDSPSVIPTPSSHDFSPG